MKKNIRVVCALLFDENNRVCITQRNDSLLAGLWEFPGGKVESTESDAFALEREIIEELDVSIEVGKHFMTTSFEYPDFAITLVSYLCTSHQIITHSHVHQGVLYVPIGELCAYFFAPADIPIVEKLVLKSTTLHPL